MTPSFTLECSKCGIVLPEREIELSHDVPRYLGGTDLDGRHYLCKRCHDSYEKFILEYVYFFLFAKKISFNEDRRKNIPYMVEIRNFLKDNPKIAKEVKENVKGLRDSFFNEEKEVTDGREIQ